MPARDTAFEDRWFSPGVTASTSLWDCGCDACKLRRDGQMRGRSRKVHMDSFCYSPARLRRVTALGFSPAPLQFEMGVRTGRQGLSMRPPGFSADLLNKRIYGICPKCQGT